MKESPKNHLKCPVKPIFIAIAICFLLPNILFYAVAYKLGIIRPLINIDYLFASLFFVLNRRIPATLLLSLLFVVDTLVIQGLAYPVIGLHDLLYLLSMLPYAAPIWQIASAGLLVLLILVAFFAYRHSYKAHRLTVLTMLLLSTSLYGLQNHFDEPSSDFYRDKNTAFGSQVAYFTNTHAIKFFDAFFQGRNHVIPVGPSDATVHLSGQSAEQLNNKILLIVAESWGVMKDVRIQQALLQPLFEKQSSLDWLTIKKTNGNTATVDAELSHLCGAKMYYYNLKPVTEGFDICLPWQFKSAGYRTISVHGADGVMYDRQDWYPRVGLDEIYFRNTRNWKTQCYSFPGICDSEILDDFILPTLAKNEKIFMYWLTLNTHTQYDNRDIQTDLFDCASFDLQEGEELCRMNKLHAQFFSRLAEVLDHPAMKGVEIIVVGDHSPPIMNQRAYKKHMEDGMVMQLHLKVKD